MEDVTDNGEVTPNASKAGKMRAGDPSGWLAKEIDRTRYFEFPEETAINFAKGIGSVRNVTAKAQMSRQAAGFKAAVQVSLESRIGPRRLAEDGLVKIALLQAGKPLFELVATGFALACQDWTSATWEAEMPADVFEAFDAVALRSGPVKARPC